MSIEGDLLRLFGSGPQGNPDEIRRCAHEFRADAHEAHNCLSEFERSYRLLAPSFKGPAAQRLATRMDSLRRQLSAQQKLLEQTATELKSAASQLECDQDAFDQRVERGRQELMAKIRDAAS